MLRNVLKVSCQKLKFGFNSLVITHNYQINTRKQKYINAKFLIFEFHILKIDEWKHLDYIIYWYAFE